VEIFERGVILDDFAIAPINASRRQDLLELLEDRDDTRSTVIASQLPHDLWHAYLGDPTVADAIIDRLIHRAAGNVIQQRYDDERVPPDSQLTDHNSIRIRV
jgi:DNA replication protein DnaC